MEGWTLNYPSNWEECSRLRLSGPYLRQLSVGRRMDIKDNSYNEFPHLGRKCRCPGYNTQVEFLDLPQARFSSSQLQQKEKSPNCLLHLFLWAFPASLSPLLRHKKDFDTDCFVDFGAMVEIRTPGGGMGGGNMETLIKIKNSEQQETEGSCLQVSPSISPP